MWGVKNNNAGHTVRKNMQCPLDDQSLLPSILRMSSMPLGKEEHELGSMQAQSNRSLIRRWHVIHVIVLRIAGQIASMSRDVIDEKWLM